MFHQKHRTLIFSTLVLVLIASATVLTLGAGNVILWSNTTNGTWQTGSNWTGGAAPDATDTAQFGVNPSANSNGVGIDMGAATNNGASNQAVGGIEVTVARTSKNVIVGNLSTTTDGVLTLNGATLNATPNAILRNGSNQNLTITNIQGTGSHIMNVALNDATDNVVLVDGSGGVVIASTLTETVAGKRLTIAGVGSGRVDITNAANQFTGGLYCKGAEVRVTTDLSLGPVPGTTADNIFVDGGRFGIVSGGLITIDPHRNIVLGSTPGTSVSAPGAGSNFIYNGVFKDLTTGGILVKQGQGVLVVGGISTYTGDTFINNGTIQLTVGDNRLPPAAALTLGQSASANLGTFDLNGFNQQIAGLNSTLGINASAGVSNLVSSATPAILTLGGSGSYTYGDNTNIANSGKINQMVSIQKTGSGTQTFGDANTYSGGTTVNGGTLLVTNTAGSATGTGSVMVGNGATLGGNGFITGPVSLASGAILSPGVSSAAILTTGSLTLDPASVLNFDLGTVSDQVAVTGDLSLAGVLNVSAGAGFASGRYVLFTYTGVMTGNGLTFGTVPPAGYSVDTATVGQVALVVSPKVISINRDTPVGADTNATSVTFRITFSSAVTGVDAADFAVAAVSGNVGTINISNVAPVSSSVYIVDVDTSTGSGEIRLDLIDNDTILDATSTPLGGTGTGNGNFTTGQTYRVDHLPLTVSVDQAVTQADPTHINSIKFTAVFNKAVADFDSSRVTVGGTALGGTATVVNSGDNKTYTITVAGLSTDGTVTALVSAGLSHDAVGNANTASTSTDNTVTFDTVAPTVINVTSAVGEGAYHIGGVIPITVQFSEPVTVMTGTPQLKLATGNVQRLVDLSSGSGTDTLLFMYTVQPGDTSSDLNYVDTSSLSLNGATISDAAGNAAVITLPGLDAAGALGVNKNIVIDTAPVIITIVPAVGPTMGGTTVAVNGNNLSQAAITFAGIAGTMLTATNSQVILLTPPHASGAVDVAAVGPQATATKVAGYLYDDPPVFNSTPVISTTSPLVGRPISVTVSATDPESEPITISYNWGDGSPVDSTGVHVYAAPGTYLITITISDGNSSSIETSIVNVASTVPMQTTKLIGAYKPNGTDTVSFTTVINGLPAGFVFANQPISINVGGALQTFTLTSKNKAVVGKSTIGIKAKLKKNTQGVLALVSGPVTVTGKLTGNFASVWLVDGIDPTKDARKLLIHMTVDVVLSGTTYTNEITPLLTGKANKGGRFTFSQK